MADQRLKRYLDVFTAKATSAGLNMGKPGQNWAPMKPIVPGSHISLSVTASQIQVNLNNDRDESRERFNALFADRAAIDAAVGERLVWEAKNGVKKSAVRATLSRGFEDGDWDDQHNWALQVMQAFVREFGARLR